MSRIGLFGGAGLILGKQGGRWLRTSDNEGHCLVVAPSGAGKGIGVIVPNLLTYAGSVICTDIKGENFATTARRRRDFGPVFRLDVGNPQTSHRFNPLDLLRPGDVRLVDDAKMLAGLIVADEGRAESHWRIKATDWLTGFILHVADTYANQPHRRNLTEVHRLVTQGPAMLGELIEELQASSIPRVQAVGFQLATADGSEESRNVLSNIAKNTEAYEAGGPLERICSASDFDLSQFYGAPQSLFVIVPEEILPFYNGFLRVVVGCAMNALMRVGKYLDADPKPLLLLDECAALGHLRPLEDGFGYLRAYARIMTVWQDLAQLERHYPNAKTTLMANSKAFVTFGVSDIDTAEALSKRLGQATIKSRSVGYSQDSQALMRHRDNDGMAETGRWLLDAAEITKLKPTEALVFLPTQVRAPIRAERMDYRQEVRFRGLYDEWRGETSDGETDAPMLTKQQRLLRARNERCNHTGQALQHEMNSRTSGMVWRQSQVVLMLSARATA